MAHSYHIQLKEPISCKENVVSAIKILPLQKQEKGYPKRQSIILVETRRVKTSVFCKTREFAGLMPDMKGPLSVNNFNQGWGSLVKGSFQFIISLMFQSTLQVLQQNES